MTGKDTRDAIKKEIAPAIQELVFEMITKEALKNRVIEILDSQDFVITLEDDNDNDSKITKKAS